MRILSVNHFQIGLFFLHNFFEFDCRLADVEQASETSRTKDQ
jgi:hypothetical protein